MQAVIWNLFAHSFSPLSLGSGGKSYYKCACDSVQLERNYSSYIEEKTVGLKRGSKKLIG